MAGMTEEEVKQVQKTIKELQGQIADHTKESADLKKELDAAKKELTDSKGEMKKAQEKADAVQQELAAAQARVKELEQQLAEASALQARVKELEQQLAEATAKKPVGMVVGASAWVRKAGGLPLNRRDGPGMGSTVLDSLPIGTEVTLQEGPKPADGFTWWRVTATDGREGWVAGEELVSQPES